MCHAHGRRARRGAGDSRRNLRDSRVGSHSFVRSCATLPRHSLRKYPHRHGAFRIPAAPEFRQDSCSARYIPSRRRSRWHEACSNNQYTEAVMIVLNKILVATDFGSASESALGYAQALARGFGAELHVLHVVENLLTRAMDGYGYAAISPEVQLDVERAGLRQTEGLLNEEDRRELRAKVSTITSNNPAAEIVDYAR